MSFVHEHRDGAEECCLQMDCLCRSGGSRGEVCRVLGNHGHRRLNCPKSRSTDAGWGRGKRRSPSRTGTMDSANCVATGPWKRRADSDRNSNLPVVFRGPSSQPGGWPAKMIIPILRSCHLRSLCRGGHRFTQLPPVDGLRTSNTSLGGDRRDQSNEGPVNREKSVKPRRAVSKGKFARVPTPSW